MRIPPNVFVVLIVICAPFVNANTSSVFSPSVKDGEQAFEYRNSYVPGENGQSGDMAQRFHYQYGLNDTFRARIIGAYSRNDGENLDYNYTRFELMHQLKEGEGSWSAALRYELQKSDRTGRPDRFRIAGTAMHNLNNGWQLRGNVLLGRQFGDNKGPGVLLELRTQVTKKIGAWGRLGVESFNDLNRISDMGTFDEQEHQAGPIYKFSLAKTKLNLSYLVGLSDGAPDDNFRLHFIVPI